MGKLEQKCPPFHWRPRCCFLNSQQGIQQSLHISLPVPCSLRYLTPTESVYPWEDIQPLWRLESGPRLPVPKSPSSTWPAIASYQQQPRFNHFVFPVNVDPNAPAQLWFPTSLTDLALIRKLDNKSLVPFILSRYSDNGPGSFKPVTIGTLC